MTPGGEGERTRVLVIGAGQAGLSVSWYLRRLGLEVGRDLVVLDRGPGTGGAWQHRWESLRLGAAHRVHDLPGMAGLGLGFADADRSAPARDVVADQYARYEDALGLDVRRPVEVTAVTGLEDGFSVRWAGRASSGLGSEAASVPISGSVRAEVVVNATGTWGAPFVPWYPGRDTFLGRQLHTSDYRAASELEGLDVVVVGGGTSAIGFVLELDGIAASTTWVTRRPVDWLDQGELDVESAVAAVAAQDRAARAGQALPSIVSGTGVPRTRRFVSGIERGVLVERPMFASVEPNGVRWADGTFAHADAIVWATGFRPELRHLAPLGLRSADGGVSVEGGASTRDPRLFFAGYGPQASTIGANRAGRAIARQVVARLSESDAERRG
ncbi:MULTISPECIES: NAD(P)-binding domain-containing protein [unclassified Frigoribacterium]|uniref:NAD(P)-binding domain-containing protein n=1 Tax=unclassified Frigoribacterium TaxID=2627005 RepID=UPI0006F41447|nr:MULTISPECIES: NAD(P)-binding domain-containing protein [unclassified Frigoribacterium]KQO45438.1 pyridine nucleotide-disulfide oxidoreductase [Frigoribacterium sp. Leaf254]KQT37140.1 pyridine nucleotide-disulfide oxidoreductase [Frigoribacterium sp. Leaf415]